MIYSFTNVCILSDSFKIKEASNFLVLTVSKWVRVQGYQFCHELDVDMKRPKIRSKKVNSLLYLQMYIHTIGHTSTPPAPYILYCSQKQLTMVSLLILGLGVNVCVCSQSANLIFWVGAPMLASFICNTWNIFHIFWRTRNVVVKNVFSKRRRYGNISSFALTALEVLFIYTFTYPDTYGYLSTCCGCEEYSTIGYWTFKYIEPKWWRN